MKPYTAKLYRLQCLRETPLPSDLLCLDTPQRAAQYWTTAIRSDPYHNPEVESLYTLMLNTRRRCTGHHLISTGTQDTLLVHPREVFRAAILASASAIVIMHNHPSGEPSPSEADVKVTRELIRAGQLLKIELLDHVIIGHPLSPHPFMSLRELGYFYS